MQVTSTSKIEENLKKEITQLKSEFQRFVYITSHDLKEPLRNVASLLGLLDQELLQTHPDEGYAEYSQAIQQCVKKMSDKLEGLLRISRVLTRNIESHESFHLSWCLTEAVKQARAELKLSPEMVETQCVQSELIESEKGFFQECFKEFVKNALSYNENPVRKILLHSEGQTIFIADNAIKIDPRKSEKIFELFWRGRASKKYSSGIGIGLTFAKLAMDGLGYEVSLLDESKSPFSPGEEINNVFILKKRQSI